MAFLAAAALSFRCRAKGAGRCTAVRNATTIVASARPSKRGAAESLALDSAVKSGVPRDVAERALAVVQRTSGVVELSEFMPWEEAEKVAYCASRALRYAHICVTGGVDEAERAALACASQGRYADDGELVEEAKDSGLRAVVLRGNLVENDVTQRDVLGAGCAAVSRSLLGDVALCEDGTAYIVTRTENADMLAASLSEVGRVSVQATVESVRNVAPRLRRVKEFYTVEKSTRLDAVASAGFGVSRTAMADRIKGGALQVNQKTVRTPAKNVNAGDRISCRGAGRIELVDVQPTRKGSHKVTVRRYL